MKNDKIIITNKKIGETPLDVIKRLKAKNSKLKTTKMAYAGRLDPMAEGLLLILVGSECRKRKEYEGLDKTYEFEILLGVATDTYDILGKITNYTTGKVNVNKLKLDSINRTFVRTYDQKYPPYSSARVNGKPLYYWAREGKLEDITIPKKQIEIFSLDLLEIYTLEKNVLKKRIFEKLNLVKGDFRQDNIKSCWEGFFEKTESKSFTIAKIRVKCSSGTYVRSIANELGNKLKSCSIAFSILRTKIGPYSLNVSG